MNRFALAALLARQPAANLAPVLKHIQMSPHQLLGVVIAVDQAPLLGASFALPEPVRLPNLQDNGRCFVVVPTLRDFPIQAESQQFLKHSFRCHAPILNGYSTQNSEEPASHSHYVVAVAFGRTRSPLRTARGSRRSAGRGLAALPSPPQGQRALDEESAFFMSPFLTSDCLYYGT